MKRNLLSRKNKYFDKIKIYTFILFAFIVSSFSFGQQVIDGTLSINKTIVESTNGCNQFDVELTITGTPPHRPIEVMLVMDTSGSMGDIISGDGQTPMYYAKEAAKDFINNIFTSVNNPTGKNKVGIVSYSNNATTRTGLINNSVVLNNIVDGLSAGGYTNIAEGINFAKNEINSNGTHDCTTIRSIIVLTDGVANRAPGESGCSTYPTSHTDCTRAAMDAGQSAMNGIPGFETKVYSVLIYGGISKNDVVDLAKDTMMGVVDNNGENYRDSRKAANLTFIYDQILQDLKWASKQISKEKAMVTDVIGDGFTLVANTLKVKNKGTVSATGQTISWFMDFVANETVKLVYTVEADSKSCGVKASSVSTINYVNTTCQEATIQFNDPDFCVPCPTVTGNITQVNCSNDFNFSGTASDDGACGTLIYSYLWEFYIDGIKDDTLTSTSLSGSLNLPTIVSLTEVKGVLTTKVKSKNGCFSFSDKVVESIITAYPPGPVISGVNTSNTTIATCPALNDGSITVVASGSNLEYSIDNGSVFQSSNVFNNITSGSYNVVVRNSVTMCSAIYASPVLISDPICIAEIGIVASIPLASEPSSNGEFTLTLDNALTIDTTISFSISGSALNGTDYATINSTILIKAGLTEIKIPVSIIDDSILEGDEEIIITLLSADNLLVIIGSASVATVTIDDDEDNSLPVEISVVGTTNGSEPSADGLFTVSLSGGMLAGSDILVGYTVSGTATADSDYTALSGSVTILSGANSATIPVEVLDDLILEGNETVDVTLSTTNNILTSVSSTIGTVTIDDDADDAVVISLNNIIINESDGEVYFTVSLTGSIQYDLSFEFNTVNGSAEDFTDYLGANGTLIIPAGSSSGYTQTISVMILEDSIPEATETFSVNLSNIQSSGSSSFLNNNGIATIIDSDAIVLSDEANVGEDISINIDVLNNDTFASDDLIEITGVTAPANGNVIINPDNTTTYTPNPDFNGEDSYEYTVTITNTDGSSTSATAAVTINVSAVNDNVVDSVTTDEEVPVIIPVLDNDGFDPSSNPVITDVTDPANGTVVINEDGTVTYTPDPDFNGEDTFEYTVSVPNSDGSVTTETGTVIIVVIGVGDVVNDFEVAIDHDPIEIDVLANDTFTTNTVVIVSEVTNPENGSAVINANGTVAYEANESFYGEDTFNYTVTVTNADGTTSTEEGSVIIAVHLTPFAIDDEILTEANIPIEINVLENDYDEDGTIDPSTVEIITNPLNGSVVINSDGTITFSPNLDYIGDDEFVYQVCDNNGLCDTAVVKVIVAGVLAADLIIPQAFSPNGDGTHDVFVINNLSNLYPNFQLQIYNRYGNIVYDYRHNGNPLTKPIWWDGFSNGRMTINRKDQVPVGTYFYTLHFNKDNAKPISGYVYLNR